MWLLPFVSVIAVKVLDGAHRNAEMEQMFTTFSETYHPFFDCLLKWPQKTDVLFCRRLPSIARVFQTSAAVTTHLDQKLTDPGLLFSLTLLFVLVTLVRNLETCYF